MGDSFPTINIFMQWGIVAKEIPLPKYEVKELPSHDYIGEHGEDTYIPSFIPLKSYDMTIQFYYKGGMDLCYTNVVEGFISYLIGNKPINDDYNSINEGGLIIYDPYNRVGKQKVYMKVFDPENMVMSSDGESLSFKITFHITDPVSNVSLSDPKKKVIL